MKSFSRDSALQTVLCRQCLAWDTPALNPIIICKNNRVISKKRNDGEVFDHTEEDFSRPLSLPRCGIRDDATQTFTTRNRNFSLLSKNGFPRSRRLKKRTLNLNCYARNVKTTTYTSKKFEINLFWTAVGILIKGTRIKISGESVISCIRKGKEQYMRSTLLVEKGMIMWRFGLWLTSTQLK